MKINTLQLTNWRNHKKASFTFDRVNVIRGVNASGKSSIAMAIEYLFTGRCEITTEAGADGELLITSGAKKATIAATLANPEMTISRERSAAGGNLVIEKAGQQFAGKTAIGVLPPSDMLSLVLRSARFLDLPPSEQFRLLSQAVEPKTIDFPQDVIDKANLAECGIPRRLSSIKEAEMLKGLFYDRRTKIGQEIRAIGTPPEPEKKDLPSMEETTAKLAGLRRELDDKRAQLARKANTYEVAVNARRELKATAARGEECPTQKQLESWTLIIDQYEKGKAIRNQEAILREKIRVLESQQAKVVSLGAVCPTCTQPIPEDARTATRASLGLQLGTLKTELAALPIVPSPEVYEKAQQQKTAGMTLIVEVEKATQRLANEPEPVEPTTTGPGNWGEQIETLRLRVENGDKVVRELAVAYERQEVYNQTVAKIEDLQERSDACTYLVDWFGPAGVQKEVVGERMAVLVDKLKSRMATWGFDVSLSLDPYAITIGINGIPLQPWQISASERFRFSVALQVTMAELTGIGLVVIDAADILNTDGRRLLSRLVNESDLEQAFIMSTAEQTQGAPPDGPGLKFFWLGK